mgnify:CR=1 FL=1
MREHAPVALMNQSSNVSAYMSVYVHAQASAASLQRPLNLSANKYYYYYINASQAIEIFLAKARRKARDPASRMLAEEYGISMKAVRDIWNFRTWKWETMPYWSQKDLHDFLSKHLCTGCRLKGVCSLQEACGSCASGSPTSGSSSSREQSHAAGSALRHRTVTVQAIVHISRQRYGCR